MARDSNHTKCDMSLNEEITQKLTEYEEIFVKLQKQIDTYKDEHEHLKKEITLLIEENKILSRNYEEVLQTKILQVENGKFQDDITTNFKNQLSIISQEKEITYDLWQNALKTIDHLEEELKLHRGHSESHITRTHLEKVKQKHELEIKEIQKQLKLLINQIQEKNKLNLENLEKRNNELQNALEEQKNAVKHLKEKDAEIKSLKDKLTEALSTNNKVINDMEKQTELINKLIVQDKEAKDKVLESVILIETAIAEKETALINEAAYKEEIEKLRLTVEQIIKDADEKVKNEAILIKEQYNNNLKRLLEDMKTLQAELNDKTLLLERATKRNEMLEEDISKLQTGKSINVDNNSTKLLILDKKLESTFQKLLLSERKNMQLAAEKQCIRMDLENMSKTFERESKSFATTKQSLERQLQTLQNELAVSNRYVEEYVQKIKELNMRMIEMEEEMSVKFQLKEQMSEEMLAEKIKQIEKENNAVKKELEKQLESEHKLNQRWKTESRKISNLLQSRIKDLKSKNTELLHLVLRCNKNIR